MKKGDAVVGKSKRLGDKRWNSITAKCHPAIFELAQLWKELIEARKKLTPDSNAAKYLPTIFELAQLWNEIREATKNPMPDLINQAMVEIEERMEKRLQEIFQKYSGPVPPAPNTFAAQTIFSNQALESKSDAQGIAEMIHWERHRIPLIQDLRKMAARNWGASQRVQRTFSDLEKLRCGEGPIQSFKIDLQHWNIFDVLWGFGLERLTPTELADFFDKFCPCGSEAHDTDSLKKRHARYKRANQRAIASQSQLSI
jgi:hypothetical protein